MTPLLSSHLWRNWRFSWVFIFRTNFLSVQKKWLLVATFLPMLNYRDLYINTSVQRLLMVDTVYHASLRFITDCEVSTSLRPTRPGDLLWPSVGPVIFRLPSIKALLGLLPAYICALTTLRSDVPSSFCSQNEVLLSVPVACTELGEKAFVYSAASSWNKLQQDWKLTVNFLECF